MAVANMEHSGTDATVSIVTYYVLNDRSLRLNSLLEG